MTSASTTQFRPRVTVFHCFNALNDVSSSEDGFDIRSVKLPCSSMTREVVLLHAFEAGADAVIVLTCPIGACHHQQGNIRAGKRVARMKKLLDEIGLDGRRLNIFNISTGDTAAVSRIISQTVSELTAIGPNPAA